MLLFTALGLLSCLSVRTSQPINKIEVFGIPLTAHTKIAIDEDLIQAPGFLLAELRNPVGFMQELQQAIGQSQPVKRGSFREWNVRLVYKPYYANGRHELVVVDQGGKYLLFREKVYLVSQPLATVIKRSLPVDSSTVISLEERQRYKRQDYWPHCCPD